MKWFRMALLILGLSSLGLSALSVSAGQRPAPKKVLVMGDSLSAAYRLPLEQGWVALLQARVDEEGLPVTLINASVSGATTAAGLRILPAALKQHSPDIVILELGANDGLQGKPLSYIRANLDTLIQLSLDASAKVLLLGIRIPPNYGSAYAEPFFRQYSQLSQQHQTALVPFFLEGVAGDRRLMLDDGKHPNAVGQRQVLENVWPVFRDLLDNRARLAD